MNFVSERGFIRGGCIYVNCKSIKYMPDLVERIATKIEQDSSQQMDILKRRHLINQDSSLSLLPLQLAALNHQKQSTISATDKFKKLMEFLSKTDE
jgi:hypothetical protein